MALALTRPARRGAYAVTSVYGEQGLRARFAVEVTPGPDGREKARQALELAARLHAADRRQREPYLNHPLRVALWIECHYGDNDLQVILRHCCATPLETTRTSSRRLLG
jgi:(p)ppGpp synthase/HD superfamily hydrolase